MDRSQWTGQGVSEPTIPPSLSQMFALARRMGYKTRPIARRASQPPGSPRAPFVSAKRKNPHYDRNRVQQNWRNLPRTHTPPLIHPTNQNHSSPTQHTFAQATQLQPPTQISPTTPTITPQHTSPTSFAYQSIPPVVSRPTTAQNHTPSPHAPHIFPSQPVRQQPTRATKKSWTHSNYKPYHMQTKIRRPPHPSHFHAEPMEVSGVADVNTPNDNHLTRHYTRHYNSTLE